MFHRIPFKKIFTKQETIIKSHKHSLSRDREKEIGGSVCVGGGDLKRVNIKRESNKQR